MSLQIIDGLPEPAAPKPKSIVIDGTTVGEATPRISEDTLSWHVVITLRLDDYHGHFLVQGFGSSVREAIADGIIRARDTIREEQQALLALERQLGVVGVDSEADVIARICRL